MYIQNDRMIVGFPPVALQKFSKRVRPERNTSGIRSKLHYYFQLLVLSIFLEDSCKHIQKIILEKFLLKLLTHFLCICFLHEFHSKPTNQVFKKFIRNPTFKASPFRRTHHHVNIIDIVNMKIAILLFSF